MGTPLGPKYIPYTYMDPLGETLDPQYVQAEPFKNVRPGEFNG